MKTELTPEHKKLLIAALAKGDIEAVKAIKQTVSGEKVIIHTFLDLLKLDTNSNQQIDFAPGPFKDFMMTTINNQNGELKPALPGVWMLPAANLTDEEIRLYVDSEDKTAL